MYYNLLIIAPVLIMFVILVGFCLYFLTGTSFLDLFATLFQRSTSLICWHCGQETPADQHVCRHCGGELQ